MDWATVGATLLTVLTGVGIALGTERYREWRTRLQQREERQRAAAKELQDILASMRTRHFRLMTEGIPTSDQQQRKQLRGEFISEFYRIHALGSRLDSPSLNQALIDLQRRALAVVGAQGRGNEEAKEQWSEAAAAVNEELGKLLR